MIPSSEQLQVDLGQTRDIQHVRILWEKANAAYRYKIEGSADGKKWKLLVDQSNNSEVKQVTPHKVDAKGTRYFKITFLGATPSYWSSLWEFEAHTGALPELPRSSPLGATGEHVLRCSERNVPSRLCRMRYRRHGAISASR